MKETKLPYDKSNPVIYENDSHEDIYTDEYLFALASAGDINLKGIITSTSYKDAWQEREILYGHLVNGRREMVDKARRSGMSNLPDPVNGPTEALVRPVSGRIEDTVPVDSSGSRLIVQEAAKASVEKPLVIIMGGQSTVVADAYLLDPSISEKVIVAWLAGESGGHLYGFNGWVDLWGTYILVSKLKTVLFGPVFEQTPFIPKKRLWELPDTELRQWMIEKELPHVNLPGLKDYDAQPAIPLMRPDYVKKISVKSFSHFDPEGISMLKEDENGNILVVDDADMDIASEEWWRAMKDVRAYGNHPKAPSNTPFHKNPFAIPGRIPAVEFDYGGQGVSYKTQRTKSGSEVLKTVFRPTDPIYFSFVENSMDEIALESLYTGEWLEYTVHIAEAGVYELEICVSSEIGGGIFHLEFDGVDKSGYITVPGTGGSQKWCEIRAGKLDLAAGEQVMTLVHDSGRINLRYLKFMKECV
jgi:hypothetical protein